MPRKRSDNRRQSNQSFHLFPGEEVLDRWGQGLCTLTSQRLLLVDRSLGRFDARCLPLDGITAGVLAYRAYPQLLALAGVLLLVAAALGMGQAPSQWPVVCLVAAVVAAIAFALTRKLAVRFTGNDGTPVTIVFDASGLAAGMDLLTQVFEARAHHRPLAAVPPGRTDSRSGPGYQA